VLGNEAVKEEVVKELVGELASRSCFLLHVSPLHSSDSGRDLSFFVEEAQGSAISCFLCDILPLSKNDQF
jgi:hypothetical protein